MAGKKIDLWADYAAHHHARGNKVCHLIGIPLIATGFLGLLAIPIFDAGLFPIELSFLLLLLIAPAYVRLDARLGAGVTALFLLLYLGARLLSWKINLGLFLAGWVFQFVGHGVYEKRSPAFFQNLLHLLVGPLWVLNTVLRLRPPSRA